MDETKCAIIHAALDDEARHVEVPCRNDATHMVYDERMPICSACLQALLAEDVLVPRELATIGPFVRNVPDET